MNENTLKKRLDFQQKMIFRQSEQIEELKIQNEKLKLKLQEKDEIINSVAILKDELVKNVADSKKYKEEFARLIDELRKMKEVINKEVFKGRWRLIKFLIK
jgi:hypothetical protein